MCLAVNIFRLDLSGTNRPILIKFYQKHHLDEENPALGFGPNQIRALVSMASDNSHRVIMGKTVCCHFSRVIFHPIQWTTELAALERLKN